MRTAPHLLGLAEARAALLSGRLVVFPTETLYALGCDALNPEAVAAVFLLKQRSPSMPLPLVAASYEQATQVAYRPPAAALALIERFWPGPLSLLLPARPCLPDLLCAHTRRVAVRQSPHPAALALCTALGRPVVATSANKSGAPAVHRQEDLDPDILSGVAGIYAEEPEPAGGAPSSLVELSENRGRALVRLLRSGAISAEEIRAAGFDLSEKIYKSPVKT
ncbi:threonylcarbamoyl-AMP synthase [Desulfovibrio sp. OttesenSCG-928-M16]|nr:threonylcarbamoyl-AMP synthase [Desulfovibrio sp. OttesenSCG-928-M16]